MHRQGFDLQLTQYDERGWRATFYVTGMEHRPLVRRARDGSARRGGRRSGRRGRRWGRPRRRAMMCAAPCWCPSWRSA